MALVFDIQRFSIHDGPGIRTTVFFKGCPLSCAWCQNPESQKAGPEVAFYAERCQGCFECEAACPRGAIVKDPDRRVDFSLCDGCGLCAEACAFDALRLVGRDMSPDELFDEVMRDRDFYEDSQGGVTFSGGEPLVHAAFLKNFLPRLKEEKIHVNLETSGQSSFAALSRVLPYLDLIYFDLKHMDPFRHRRWTGADNRKILENFSRIAPMFPGLTPRMPVIPTVNDDPANIKATALFLTENRKDAIHLLPYHRMGESKLPRIQTALKPLDLPDGNEAAQRAKALFEQEGIHVLVYE